MRQTKADSKRTSAGPSDVEVDSTTLSIATPETAATVLSDQHTVLPDQAALDTPPTLPLPAKLKQIRLMCPLCDAVFSSKQYLKSHRKSSHLKHQIQPNGIDSTLCITCNRDFPTPNALILHLRNSTLHAAKHYCRVCSLHFFTPGASVVHGVLAHGLDLPCELCSYWFATEEQRAEHLKAAHTEPVARLKVGRKVDRKAAGAAARGRGFLSGTSAERGFRSLATVFADDENLMDID